MKSVLAFALLGTAFVALAGCLDSSSCTALGPEAEQASMSFNVCETTLRWDGTADSLTVDKVGRLVDEWSELNLLLARPPNPETVVLAMEHGKPATRDSPRVRSDVVEPFSNHATGAITTGDTFFFCRIAPTNTAKVIVDVHVDLPGERTGGATIPTEIRGC